jgi:putative molybdopterin biosynthesis protein
VLPLIARLLGAAPDKGEIINAILSRQLSSPIGVDEFVRVNLGLVGDQFIATPASRGAGLLMSVVRSDGMLRIPSGSDGFAAGSAVEVEIFRTRDAIRNTLVCIGSHDNALDLLGNALKKRSPELSLSSAHVGSMGGIMAILKGNAHMAGVHLLDSDTGEYNVQFIKRYLSEKAVILVNFTYRMQGLLVKKGNPKKITCLDDLVRKDVMFINRQAGSGTRLLLDKSLGDRGIDPPAIRGYDREEFTHMAVASSVLTGLADAGLAVFHAAKALNLDFIPVAEERYDLIIPVEYLKTEKIAAMLEIIRHDVGFRESVAGLGGYDTRDMGKLVLET